MLIRLISLVIFLSFLNTSKAVLAEEVIFPKKNLQYLKKLREILVKVQS